MKKKYTVAIMPFSGRSMRTFSISLSSLIVSTISISLVFLSGIAFASLKIWKAYDSQVKETATVVQKYSSLQNDFQNLQKELTEIKETYQAFKGVLGVDYSKSEIINNSESYKLDGKGGPEEPESIESIANDLEIEISATMKEAIYLKSAMEELVENANSKIAKLARMPSICPIWVGPGREYRVSSEPGIRISPFTGLLEYHQGLDIPAPIGTPILATADGTVEEVGTEGGYGNYIIIHHDERYSTLYGHMYSHIYNMIKGCPVKRYDTIGYVGSTGRSTGPHIHYEVRYNGKRVNPLDYILN